MGARVLLLAAFWGAWQTDPYTLVIATPGGDKIVPVVTNHGVAAVAAPALAQAIALEVVGDVGGIRVTLAGRAFRFYMGAPYVRTGDSVYPLVAPPYVSGDTVYLPLQWLTEYVPRVMPARFRFDPARRRLEEIPPIIVASSPPGAAPAPAAAARHGLRWRHQVTVDPGHGGVDPGNPGLFFPGGMQEKDVTLSVARDVKAELERRGIDVVLTRAKDTLIALRDRARFCAGECDLFVSIHVNSMPRGRRQTEIRGLETYFLAEARTEDARRVAAMENEAVRFETAPRAGPGTEDPLRFMLGDLQLAEHLRESARLAELVHGETARVHPGGNRGVRQAEFAVLTTARRPAILVEVGFATNRRDAQYIVSRDGQQKLAVAIADGVVSYLLEYERRLGGGRPASGGRGASR